MMSLAESFATTFSPSFFSENFLEKANIPKIEFEVMETPEHLRDQEPSWIEETATALYHLPKVDLDVWQGVDAVGAPEYQEWWICVNNRGLEEPRWDIDTCTEPEKRNFYNVTCQNTFNDTLFEFVATCTYCVTKWDNETAYCTDPCENATSRTDEFN